MQYTSEQPVTDAMQEKGSKGSIDRLVATKLDTEGSVLFMDKATASASCVLHRPSVILLCVDGKRPGLVPCNEARLGLSKAFEEWEIAWM